MHKEGDDIVDSSRTIPPKGINQTFTTTTAEQIRNAIHIPMSNACKGSQTSVRCQSSDAPRSGQELGSKILRNLEAGSMVSM